MHVAVAPIAGQSFGPFKKARSREGPNCQLPLRPNGSPGPELHGRAIGLDLGRSRIVGLATPQHRVVWFGHVALVLVQPRAT